MKSEANARIGQKPLVCSSLLVKATRMKRTHNVQEREVLGRRRNHKRIKASFTIFVMRIRAWTLWKTHGTRPSEEEVTRPLGDPGWAGDPMRAACHSLHTEVILIGSCEVTAWNGRLIHIR